MTLHEKLLLLQMTEQWSDQTLARRLKISTRNLDHFWKHPNVRSNVTLKIDCFLRYYESAKSNQLKKYGQRLVSSLDALQVDRRNISEMINLIQKIETLLQ